MDASNIPINCHEHLFSCSSPQTQNIRHYRVDCFIYNFDKCLKREIHPTYYLSTVNSSSALFIHSVKAESCHNSVVSLHLNMGTIIFIMNSQAHLHGKYYLILDIVMWHELQSSNQLALFKEWVLLCGWLLFDKTMEPQCQGCSQKQPHVNASYKVAPTHLKALAQ